MNEERAEGYSEPPISHKRRVSWYRKASSLWLAGLTTVVLAAGGAVVVYRAQSAHEATPEQVVAGTSQAGFRLYYPDPLPAGFEYRQNTMNASQTAVSYEIADKAGETVVVNIQPKPQTVQFDDFHDRLLSAKVDVASAYGKAVTGRAGGKLIGSLIDDRVWVLLNADSTFDAEVMHQLVAGLKPVR